MHIWLIAQDLRPTYTAETNYDTARMMDEIAKRGHTSEVIYMNPWSSTEPGFERHTPQDIADRVLVRNGVKIPAPDLAILRNSIPTGWYVNNINLLSALQGLDVTVINDINRQVEMTSKINVQNALEAAGVPTPETVILPYPLEDISIISSKIGYPCVIKLEYGFEGKFTKLCKSESELIANANMLANAPDRLATTRRIIVQEYIQDAFSTFSAHIVGDFINADIRCGDPTNLDPFKASGESGNMRFQYQLTDELVDITKRALAAIQLDFTRFDLLKKNGKFLILEANVSGTFTRTENCNRRNIAGAIVDHALAVHATKTLARAELSSQQDPDTSLDNSVPIDLTTQQP